MLTLRIGTRLAVLTILLMLFVACETDTKDTGPAVTLPSVTATSIPALPSPAPTRTLYYAPQSPPVSYIEAVAPSPGSILNVQDFRDGKHEEGGTRWHVAEALTPSICAKLHAVPLLQPGDDFSEANPFLERIEFIVDDQVLPRPYGIGSVATLTSLMEGDEEVAVATGPFFFCWKADLGVGIHTAHLKVRKTLGEIVEYKWSFTLTVD